MTDIVGVLGESNGVSVATTVVYTVPAGKAAKVKLFYRGTAGVNSTLAILINGLTIMTTGALTSGNFIYSSGAALNETSGTAPLGDTQATTGAPAPEEYYLSAGDTVSYVIGTADFGAMSFQVVGAEVDVI